MTLFIKWLISWKFTATCLLLVLNYSIIYWAASQVRKCAHTHVPYTCSEQHSCPVWHVCTLKHDILFNVALKPRPCIVEKKIPLNSQTHWQESKDELLTRGIIWTRKAKQSRSRFRFEFVNWNELILRACVICDKFQPVHSSHYQNSTWRTNFSRISRLVRCLHCTDLKTVSC